MVKKKKSKQTIFCQVWLYTQGLTLKTILEFPSYDKSITAYEHIFGFSPLVVVMISVCTLRFWS